MKKNIIILSLVLLLASCAPVYVPNLRNSPMFVSGGEFQGTVQLGNGFDAQGALSITNNIGVMGNFSYANRTDIDNVDQYHYHKLFEGGIGYFKNSGMTCFEIFAGYGKGEGSGYDKFTIFGTTEDIRAKGTFERYFIQPAIGLNKKMMNVSFVSRVSFVNMNQFSDLSNSVAVADNRTAVFLEPGVVGRLNFADRHMFFTFQGGTSLRVSDGQSSSWNHRPFQMGLGMGIRIGGRIE